MKKTNTIKKLLLIFCLLFFTGNMCGQEHSDNISLVGQIGNGYVKSIEAKDNYLFVGNGTLLKIYNFTDPTNPELIKSILNFNTINGLNIWNNILFVATGNELKLYNIDNITSPQSISRIEIPETILSSKVLDGKLYLMLGTKGFRIYDISDIQSPVEVAEWTNVEYTWDIEQIDKYLLVADGTYGVRIIDISDMSNLKELNHLPTYRAMSLEFKGNIGYISNQINMLIVDFSDPVNPKILKEYDTGAETRDLVIEGNYAYIANTTSGLKILEISDPVNPVEISNLLPTRTFFYMKIIKSANFVYAIGQGSDPYVNVIDISDIKNIKEIYTLTGEESFSTSTFYKNYLLVNGLKVIYDVSDPSNIKEIYRPEINYAFPSILSFNQNVTIKDSILYIEAEDGIYIWNINDIYNLKLVTEIPTNNTLHITFYKNYLITASEYRTYIYDIRNLNEPFLMGIYYFDLGGAKTVEVKDNFAYVGNIHEAIQILDVSRPTLPRLIQVFNSPYQCINLKIAGNILYSAEFKGGLRIIDITNPYSPVELKRLFESERINSIVIEKNFVYLIDYSWSDLYALGNSSVKVLDISNTSDPIVAGYYNFSGISFSNMAVKDGLISLTSTTNGIYLLKFDEDNYNKNKKVNYSSELLLSQNYPNPCNPTTTIRYQIPQAEFVSLKVYDVLGKEVATLVNEEKPAGKYNVTFNGSNLSSGVYFYQIRSGGFVETKKFVLIK